MKAAATSALAAALLLPLLATAQTMKAPSDPGMAKPPKPMVLPSSMPATASAKLSHVLLRRCIRPPDSWTGGVCGLLFGPARRHMAVASAMTRSMVASWASQV